MSDSPLQDAGALLLEAAETLSGDSDARACLRYAAEYLATRNKSHVQTSRSLYLGLPGAVRKAAQDSLFRAADQVLPLAAPFNPDDAAVRADILSIGNIYGVYYPCRNLDIALTQGDIPNALYTREEILLATLLRGCQWDDLAEMVRILLDAGTDPNCREEDNPNWTPLHFAAKYGDAEVAEVLLKRGARLDVRDADGQTPADMPDHKDRMAACFARWSPNG